MAVDQYTSSVSQRVKSKPGVSTELCNEVDLPVGTGEGSELIVCLCRSKRKVRDSSQAEEQARQAEVVGCGRCRD